MVGRHDPVMARDLAYATGDNDGSAHGVGAGERADRGRDGKTGRSARGGNVLDGNVNVLDGLDGNVLGSNAGCGVPRGDEWIGQRRGPHHQHQRDRL